MTRQIRFPYLTDDNDSGDFITLFYFCFCFIANVYYCDPGKQLQMTLTLGIDRGAVAAMRIGERGGVS